MEEYVLRRKGVADRVRYESLLAGATSNNPQVSGLIDVKADGTSEKQSDSQYDSYYSLYGSSLPLRWAVGLKAAQFAQLPLGLTEKRNGSSERPVEKHNFLNLMSWINPVTTQYEFLRAISSYADITDRWAFLIEETPVTDPMYAVQPISLYVLNPAWLNPVVDKERGLIGYEYTPRSKQGSRLLTQVGLKTIPLQPSQVVASWGFDPNQTHSGMSILNALTEDLKVAKNARTQQSNWYATYANFGGVLYTDGGEDEFERLSKKLKKMGGAKNAYQVLVLGHDSKFENKIPGGESNSKDMENIREVDKQIMQAIGVPSGLYTGDPANGKYIELLSQMFYLAILPFSVCFTQRLTKDVLWRYFGDRKITVTMDSRNVPAMRLYDLDRTRVLVAKVLAGIMSPDEARRDSGSPEFDIVLDEAVASTLGPGATEAYKQYGKLPRPLLNMLAAGDATGNASGTPSMDLTGTNGGRNQSSDGEAQMLDTTGTKRMKFVSEEDEETFTRISKIINAM